MDWAQWLATVLAALVGSVVGSLSTIGVEWFRQRSERSTRRQDRRDDFQRDTIIELQETLGAAVQAILKARHSGVAFRGEDEAFVVPDYVNVGLISSLERVTYLNPRVDDVDLRSYVLEVGEELYDLLEIHGEEKFDERWDDAWAKIQQLNKRAGELIRSL